MYVTKSIRFIDRNIEEFHFLDTHIIFRVDFENSISISAEKRMMEGPKLPNITAETFFKVIFC